jgi:hypothetical protein
LEKPYGWLFVITTKRFLETHDPGDGFAGVGPVLVRREDGSIVEFPSVHSMESASEEYEAGLDEEGRGMRTARVFDGLGPDGEPYFAPDHEIVHDVSERERLVRYLRAGTLFLSPMTWEADRVDPSLGQVVPTGFRTDGTWSWTDTVTYYLDVHGLAPDEELRRHIEANDYRCPEVDDATLTRALQELYRRSQAADVSRPEDVPPPTTLETPDGTLEIASNLTREEAELLQQMLRDFHDR